MRRFQGVQSDVRLGARPDESRIGDLVVSFKRFVFRESKLIEVDPERAVMHRSCIQIHDDEDDI